jgi:hypothetical protein
MLNVCVDCGGSVELCYQLTLPPRCEDCTAINFDRLSVMRGVQTVAEMLGNPVKAPPELLDAA